MEMMNLFKVIIVIQLFYAISISLIVYSIPSESLDYVTSFSDLSEDIDLEGVGSQVQGSLEEQTNIPVVELGALVFYSGNILIDLLLNFAFAIPEMIGLVINGLSLLLNLDTFIVAYVELFASVLVIVMYFVGILQTLINVRSGRIV